MTKVLIAEDDLMIADLIEDSLVSAGYETCGIARTVAEAIKLCWLHRPDLVIVDMRLADGGIGTEIAAELPDDHRIGILYCSGNSNQKIDLGDGIAYIIKPFHTNELRIALKSIEQVVFNPDVPLRSSAAFDTSAQPASASWELSNA